MSGLGAEQAAAQAGEVIAVPNILWAAQTSLEVDAGS